MQFRLITFGELALHDCAAERTRPVHRKALAVLAVLAVAGKKGMTRERLLALLWPESSDESARGALKQTIYGIRQATGTNDAVIGNTELALDPAVIRSDVAEFEAALAQQDWERLVGIHRGLFLDGLSLRNCDEFDRWAEVQRDRYRHGFRRAVERLATQAAATGQTRKAIEWWRVLAADDPLSAPAAIGLMKALSDSGDTASALAHYRTYEVILREELEAAPNAAVTHMAAQVRESNGNGHSQKPDEVSTPPSAPAVLSEHALSRVTHRTRAKYGVLLAAAAVLLLVVAALLVRRTITAKSSPTAIAVMTFQNMSGDNDLDAVAFMASDRITEGVTRAHLAPVIEPSFDSAEATPARPRAKMVVTGRVYADTDSLRFHASVADAGDGRILAAFGPLAYSRADPVRAVSDVSDLVIGALARVYDKRLSDVMDSLQPPPRGAAYQHYVRGLQLYVRDFQPDSALGSFRAAYASDTNFVTALVWSVWSLRSGGRHEEARRLVDSIALRRVGLGPLQRNATDALVAMYAGDWNGAIAASARAADIAPRSEWAWYHADFTLQSNRPREALRLLRRIDPSSGWLGESTIRYWDAVAIAQHVSGDFQGELETIDAAPSNHSSHLHFLRGLNLAAHGRYQDLHGYVRERLKSDTVSNVIAIETIAREMVEHRIGRNGSAGKAALDSVVIEYRAWLARRKAPLSARFRFSHANILYHAGRIEEAEQVLAALVAEHPEDLYFAGSLARTVARLGDSTRARALLATFTESPPYLYKHQSQSLNVWRAQVEAWLGHRAEATSLLAAAFRNGLKHLHIRHTWHSAFPTLRGYEPFEQLVGSK